MAATPTPPTTKPTSSSVFAPPCAELARMYAASFGHGTPGEHAELRSLACACAPARKPIPTPVATTPATPTMMPAVRFACEGGCAAGCSGPGATAGEGSTGVTGAGVGGLVAADVSTSSG